MVDNVFRLMSAVEAEDELGAKYFYRQRTYRYQKAGKLKAFGFRGQQCFLPHKLLGVYIDELKAKILTTVPELKDANIFYDEETHRMVVDGIFGKYVAVQTDKENQEDLINKLLAVREWVMTEEPEELDEVILTEEEVAPEEVVPVEKGVTISVEEKPSPGVFPSEIQFMQIDTGTVEGVEVKSFTLMSLPSMANFIGVRSDMFARWVQKTSFNNFVVSIHGSKIGGPQISGPFKKGFEKGYTPLLPLELVPEVLVALRQSGLTPDYPARAEQLYMVAKSTLEAVGLAISGNEDKAAAELAKVSEGLGISAANQVIEIFKRYESRPFQVKENKRFRGKVTSLGQDIKVVTGEITFGVTGRLPGAWIALGTAKKLPAKDRTSGREVMRHISPEDSVGVTFSESHFIKDHTNMEEVKKTGIQGKEFYKRLKDVGLLDD